MNNRRTRTPLWIKSADAMAVDIRHNGVYIRSHIRPSTERQSDTDIPVTRWDGTTYRFDRSRVEGRDFSVYCAVLTIQP